MGRLRPGRFGIPSGICRKYLRLPHHADCDDAVAARAKKYRDFHAAEVRKMVAESSESESEDD